MRPASPAAVRRAAPVTLVGPDAPILCDPWLDLVDAARTARGDAAGAACEAPAGNVPAGDIAQGRIPHGDIPGGDIPGGDIPGGDIIVAPGQLSGVAHDRPGRLGVRVTGDARLDELAALLPRLALVAVEFPTFRDGRGYSLARLLRRRHGFGGDIRAVGDVLRDQLGLMWRCGFTSAALRDRDPLAALAAAGAQHRLAYQPGADATLPVWTLRRGAATRAGD